MDKDAIRKILSETYAARVREDVDGMLRHFADDAVFELAGASEASPAPVQCHGLEAIRSAMAGLNAVFELSDHEILSLVLDGSEASVHTRFRVRSSASGREAVTETADLVSFRDGRITRFIQFCDTALAAKLIGA